MSIKAQSVVGTSRRARGRQAGVVRRKENELSAVRAVHLTNTTDLARGRYRFEGHRGRNFFDAPGG